MIEELLREAAAGPWALTLLFALVLLDAFLVVVPGEIAVTACAALAVATGEPQLLSVVAVAAAAAICGDVSCYAIGRALSTRGGPSARRPRLRTALAWASARVHDRTGVVLFTARFIPFARLAVNLTAGAARLPALPYLGIAALAGLAWTIYQSALGALGGALFPDAPLWAVLLSVIAAVILGTVIDLIARKTSRRRARG